jgi:transposase
MEPTRTSNAQDMREYRRLCACNMYQLGFRQVDIAEALQVTQGAVSQWIKRGRQPGPEALRATKPSGRTARLNQQQKAQLPTLLDQGAEACGFVGAVWTRRRVACLIYKQFGIRYSDAHISWHRVILSGEFCLVTLVYPKVSRCLDQNEYLHEFRGM